MKFHIIKLLAIVGAIVIVTLVSGCSDRQKEAREQLGKLNIEYSQESLIKSIQNGDETVCQLFADAGMTLKDIKSNDGKTLLWTAVNAKKINIIDCLLKNGVDIEAKDSNGETVTYYVAYYLNTDTADNLGLLKHLISKGAKLDVKDKKGVDIITKAELARSSKEKIQILLDAGAPDGREEFYQKQKQEQEKIRLVKRAEEVKHVAKFEQIFVNDNISDQYSKPVKVIDVKNVRCDNEDNIYVSIDVENLNDHSAHINTVQFFIYFSNKSPLASMYNGYLWIESDDKSKKIQLINSVKRDTIPIFDKGKSITLDMTFYDVRKELQNLSNASLYFLNDDGSVKKIADFK